MPFRKTELDEVNQYVMKALQAIRDLPPAEVAVEATRTRVYRLLSNAATEIMNAAYVKTMAEAEVTRVPSRRSTLLPKGPAGRGGVDEHESKPSLSLDLDEILGLNKT
jgi:hypothetical protein